MSKAMFAAGFVLALALTVCEGLSNTVFIATAALSCVLMAGSHLYA